MITIERKKLEQALHELEGIPVYKKYGVRISNAITALKEALAQPAQEPVAWLYQCTEDNSTVVLQRRTNWAESGTGLWIETPYYTTPQQRRWVGLTDDERDEILDSYLTAGGRARAIEQALKEKNT